MDVSNGLNCIRIYSNLVKQVISFETSPLVDCMMYSTMGLNNVCSFSHLNMPGVCISDLRWVQFDVRDGDDEVSIISGIYIISGLHIQQTDSTTFVHILFTFSHSFCIIQLCFRMNRSRESASQSLSINQSYSNKSIYSHC